MHSEPLPFIPSLLPSIKKSLIVLATFMLAVIAGASAEAQTSYTYIDLGRVSVASVNNTGQIVGTVSGPRAFVITPDGGAWYRDANSDGVNDLMTLLTLPSGSTGSIGHAINASGETVGELRPSQQAMFVGVGGPAEVLTSRGGVANGINDSSVVAGWAWDSGRNYWNAAIWKKTVTRKGTTWTQTRLGAPSGYTLSMAWDINSDGALAARAEGNGIAPALWLPSPLYGFPQGWTVLPGRLGIGGDSRSINDRGQLAGASYGHAVLWTLTAGVATLQDLHPVNSIFTDSWANGLNNAPGGVLSVVGYMWNDVTEHAFLWRNGQAIDLNDVTANPPSGFLLWEAVAVNDSGVIIGYSVPPNADYSQQRAFVLVPNL